MSRVEIVLLSLLDEDDLRQLHEMTGAMLQSIDHEREERSAAWASVTRCPGCGLEADSAEYLCADCEEFGTPDELTGRSISRLRVGLRDGLL